MMGVNVATASALPFTAMGGASRNANWSPSRRRVASETRMVVSWTFVRLSMREARFTVSPMAVYSRRCGAPMSPTTARPVWMPMPMRNGGSPNRCGPR